MRTLSSLVVSGLEKGASWNAYAIPGQMIVLSILFLCIIVVGDRIRALHHVYSFDVMVCFPRGGGFFIGNLKDVHESL